jgi:hypothetical protein
MALSQNSLNNGARWEVIWRPPASSNGYAHKRFDEDFGAALKLYSKLEQAGRKGVTLRCCNIGFPPPVSITEHEQVSYKIVKRGGKRYRRKVITYEDLMPDYNARGIYWCPYCIKLRRFEADTLKRSVHCPVCSVSTKDFYVRLHNPKATTIEWRSYGRRPRRVRRRAKQR